MTKIQRLGRNSIIKQANMAATVSDDVPLPEGVILRSEDEMVIWRQFTRARARDDWRDMDLILLAKIVRVESDIRKHQIRLDATGVIIKNDRGTPIPNPLLSIIDTLQRQQLSIIRSLSICQTPTDPRTMTAAGRNQADMRITFNNNLSDLIPRQ